MIKKIIFNISNKTDTQQYLKASSDYISSDNHKIVYDFPSLPSGWVWNGYYTRTINSVALDYFGDVAIRVAYDKKNKKHHAYLPIFIIPFLKITIFDLQLIIINFFKFNSIFDVIEQYSIGALEYLDLSTSTCYSYLNWFMTECRTKLNVQFDNNCLSDLRYKSPSILNQYLEYLQTNIQPP